MNNHRAYDIAFVGLKPGVHVFEYKVDDKFFADYGAQDFDNSDVNVKLSLDKNAALILLKFEISGTVDVLCDRCANTIKTELWDEFEMVVKMVENPEEMNEQEEDPDIFYIKFSESHLHLADWLYEFVNLSVPAQRHCGVDEEGSSKCNPEVLKKLKQMKSDADVNTSNVWKDLDKLKGLDESELN